MTEGKQLRCTLWLPLFTVRELPQGQEDGGTQQEPATFLSWGYRVCGLGRFRWLVFARHDTKEKRAAQSSVALAWIVICAWICMYMREVREVGEIITSRKRREHSQISEGLETVCEPTSKRRKCFEVHKTWSKYSESYCLKNLEKSVFD